MASVESKRCHYPACLYTSKCQRLGQFMKNNLMVILLISSLVLAVIVGAIVKVGTGKVYTDREIDLISYPGTLFLNALMMLIIPLLTSSLITGMASLDQKSSGSLGKKAIVYYLTTSVTAAIIGIVLVVSIKPGRVGKEDVERDELEGTKEVDAADTIMDLIRNMLPSNIVAACFRQYKTERVVEYDNETNTTMVKHVVGTKDRMNVMGLLVFSLIFGIIIGKLEEVGKPLRDFFNSLFEATMMFVKGIIWLSPFGVFFLVLGKLLEMDEWALMFGQLGLFIITVVVGLFIHGVVILPLIYYFFVRQNPFSFLKKIIPALITAFSVDSSAATLPVTMTCLEENLKVDKRITRFVLPIGATVNMDGTALYEAVASIFIAQLNDIPLDVKDIITISVTATLASIGAAAIPHAGLITMVIVLNAVGIPIDDISLIFIVDWFLDRCRTMVNIEGDSIGAGVIYHLTKDQLNAEDPPGYKPCENDEPVVENGAEETRFTHEINETEVAQADSIA
ncbi:excitatory amino acid transporter 1-like [Anneissia japonica]|uniref:excitatory amino acid transporter 1-like n=1 Tax=Anneissia japonica TaxID=1529436 RepID=UPI0014257C1D|nr:excitatory amino acid transporter 1-like [Anneissia japonica]